MDASSRTGIIYALVSPSGKIYIGQTVVSLAKRVRAHLNTARRGGDQVICHAIRKYGHENIEVIGLENTTDVDEAEKFWINYLGTMVPHGYNTKTGGTSGYVYSEESRRKMSASSTGRVRPQWEKDKISNTMRGVRKSEETRARMRAAQKGRVPREAIAAAQILKCKKVLARNQETGDILRFASGLEASAHFNKKCRTFAHGAIKRGTPTRSGWLLSYE